MRALTKTVPALLALALAAIALSGPRGAIAAETGGTFASVGGHLSMGYAKLFVTDAPGGSISLSAGLDAPVAPGWRAGVDVGYHLLGSRTVDRGSVLATLDYSVFEAIAFAHWQPPLSPLGRVSLGAGLFAAKADLSASGGGAAFGDLAVKEVAPEIAAQVTLISGRPSPVRIGVELGVHVGLLEQDSWTLGMLRLTAHY